MKASSNPSPKNPEFQLEPQDRIVVIGAGGYIANELYLRNLVDLGVDPAQIALVETDQERLRKVSEHLPKAQTFGSTDNALERLAAQSNRTPFIFVTSSTAAHAANIRSIIEAAHKGLLDLEQTKVWCEKPVTNPEAFAATYELMRQQPHFDLSVGYILRFSPTLDVLQRHLQEQQLRVSGMEWTYGKDRTNDTRPSQGVFPDEIVHPLSVTDLILTRVAGPAVSVEVAAAEMHRRPFVNETAQRKARAANPDTPLRPTSDVRTTLRYHFEQASVSTTVPVSIVASFLLETEQRLAHIFTEGPTGAETLLLEFDVRSTNADGRTVRTDRLSHEDGTVIFESSDDKSRRQILDFLNGSHGTSGSQSEALTDLRGEIRIQHILRDIGQLAALNTK